MAPTVKAILSASPLFDAFSLSLARGVWAIPFLAIVAALTWPRKTPLRRVDVASFVAVALLAAFGLNLLFQIAIAKTSAAHAVLFQGLSPLALAGLEAIVFRRALDRQRIAGIGFGVAGIALLTRAARAKAPPSRAMRSCSFGSRFSRPIRCSFARSRRVTRRSSQARLDGGSGSFSSLSPARHSSATPCATRLLCRSMPWESSASWRS